jgi:hypothetical protein
MALPYESYNIDEVGAKNIPQLEDVVLNNLADGEVLTYNSSTEKWENNVIISEAGTLDGLTDTNINSVADNEVLAYNSTTSKWENTTLIDIDSLSNLSDTNINALADAQFLRYDANVSNKWINTDLNLEGIKDVNITGIANTEVLKYDNGNWVNSTILVNELQDVNITNLQNNEVLKYNSVTNKWENKDNTDSIDELQDTNITSLTNNNILKYNSASSKWVNTFINFGELQDVNLNTLTNGAIIKYNSTNTEWETSSLSLNELNDVNTAGVVNTNVLKYDSTSTNWYPSFMQLNELIDINISNPVNSQFLAYNSSLGKWVNTTYTDLDTISNLSDTNITSLTNKDLLVYDSATSKWINDKINLNDLNDVNTAGVVNTNVLKYDSGSSNWFPSFMQLNELIDTNITSPGATEVLKYNGSKWENALVNVNEINGIDLTQVVANELLKKDSDNANEIVGAKLRTSVTSNATSVTHEINTLYQDGIFLNELSSIKSKKDNGVYSMVLNPYEANANQKGMTLLAHNNNIRVGINVANPTEDLEIDGNIQLDSNNQSKIIFYDAQTPHTHAEIDALGQGTNGGQLIFKTKNDEGNVSEKMRITDEGAVGIGIFPEQQLHVNGGIKINDKIYGTNDQIELYTNTTSYNSYSWMEMRADKCVIGGARINFRTNSTNTSYGDLAMTLLANGNVGIGTFTPSYKLHVTGDIKGDNLLLGEHNSTPKIDMFFIDKSVATGNNNYHAIWDTKIEIGKSDDFTNSPAYPPSNAYGMNVQANSDGLFVGVETYNAGNDWRPLLKWGDDSTDTPFRIVSHSGGHSYEFGTDGILTAPGKVIAETNALIGGNHKNYGTGGAFFAHKDRYNNNNDSHAIYASNGGSLILNSSNNTPVVITHQNVYNHFFHSNGNVSFGANDNSQRLTVNGNLKLGGVLLNTFGGSSNAIEIETALAWSGSSNTLARVVANQYTASLRVYDSNNSLITEMSPYMNGYIYKKGTFWDTSDDRLKSYETDVSNATSLVMKMNAKFYKKHPTLVTEDPKPDLSGVLHFNEYGFIAQELNEDPALSHFVSQHPESGIYHVNYTQMIPLLVQTIKELNERIKILESRL